jgi:hypothetical protein
VVSVYVKNPSKFSHVKKTIRVTRYGKNSRCPATTYCRVLAHGKEIFAVQQRKRTAMRSARQREPKAHGKEEAHGKQKAHNKEF